MEGRPSRGRGGGWKRGGRDRNGIESHGGEYRGRGRGGHHRGRGKRDYHRGRGRGEGAHVAEFHHRDQDEGGNCHEDKDDSMEVFSRRTLESNWDRYEESERPKSADDTPTQRGTDYHILLESAGDSFTQFRFSEEKDWEKDSFAASQMSAAFVDLPALAESLQQVPLHQRLNLEAELVQVSTPVELPAVTLATKQETPRIVAFTPPPAAPNSLGTNKNISVASNPAPRSIPSGGADTPVDDADEELDQLLSFEKTVSGGQCVSVEDAAPEEVCQEVKEEVTAVKEEKKSDEVKDNHVNSPTSAPVRQEMTEEDLEDWLDSMIS
ncbi:cell death regulator Aven [Aulostomus maculatus]